MVVECDVAGSGNTVGLRSLRRHGFECRRFLGAQVAPTREVAVVKLIAQGRRNKEIASKLGISLETAKVHVKHLLA